jgi:hypothetical protein
MMYPPLVTVATRLLPDLAPGDESGPVLTRIDRHLRLGRLSGSNGWMAAQTSSGINGSAMAADVQEIAMAPDHPAPHLTM